MKANITPNYSDSGKNPVNCGNAWEKHKVWNTLPTLKPWVAAGWRLTAQAAEPAVLLHCGIRDQDKENTLVLPSFLLSCFKD